MSIQIDVHLAGKKPDQHATRFSRLIYIQSRTISHVVRVGTLLLVPTRSKQAPTHERCLGDQRQTDPAVALGHLIPPPHGSLGVGERVFGPVIT
jgi:hypothetical protein